jgi:bacterioferritin (cytochrome b1)
MTIKDLVDLLRADMSRELAHWHFYMHAAMNVSGHSRPELRELFLEEAKGEMGHVQEFGDLIIGLGGMPATEVAPFASGVTCPQALLKAAIDMESEVVSNYVERMDQCDEIMKNGGLDKVDATYVHLFLEEQMMDSRKAVDEYNKILKKQQH